MNKLTKQEIMQASHKLAKAFKVKANNTGDYVVYLSFAMKFIINQANKGVPSITVKAGVNKVLAKYKLNCFFTKTVKVSSTHGLIKVTHEYKLNKVELEKGQYLGKRFVKNNMWCAWVRSEKLVSEIV